MDQFFALSKVAGLLFAPSNLVVGFMLGGVVLARFAKTHRWGRRLTISGLASFLAMALLPIGDGLMAVLERRFPPIELCSALSDLKPGGIILLGGGMTPRMLDRMPVDDMNDAADRVREAARLARRFADIPLLVSGGQAFDTGANRSEAAAMSDLLVELGVARNRIELEAASRTTAENGAFSTRILDGRPWLLVTSAFHMPRAIGVFQKQGAQVIAAPTDWRVWPDASPFQFNASRNLGAIDMAVKEYLGLFGYWVTGRTGSLLPGPDRACPQA